MTVDTAKKIDFPVNDSRSVFNIWLPCVCCYMTSSLYISLLSSNNGIITEFAVAFPLHPLFPDRFRKKKTNNLMETIVLRQSVRAVVQK